MASIIRNWTVSNGSVLRPTVGDSKLSFTDLDHRGWLKCDGRLVNVTDFISLFKVIGYTFGGSGSQFKLPDMRGRVGGAAGAGEVRDDANRLLSSRSKGQYTGEEVHLLNINEMPAHKHGSADVSGNNNGNGNTTSNGSHNHTLGDIPQGTQDISALGGGSTTAADEVRYTGTTSTAPDHYHTIGSTGGSNVHNNMQPTLFVGNAFIYSGNFHYGAWPLKEDTDIL